MYRKNIYFMTVRLNAYAAGGRILKRLENSVENPVKLGVSMRFGNFV